MSSTAPADGMIQTKSQGERKRRAMPHIPIEVLRQISAHLDLPSAAALSRTCKALRDAGEVRVWEEVDLSCGRDRMSFTELLCPLPLRSLTASPLPRSPLKVDYCETWNWTEEEHKSSLSFVASRIASRRSAIESYPPRAEYIRAIRLEPEGGENGSLAKGVLDILRLVSGSLRRLYVLPCIYTSQPSPTGDPITFDSYFLNGLTEIGVFPMVESLATFDFEGTTMTFSLIRKCPNLKALDMCTGSATPQDVPLHAHFPPMPKVERVNIHHMQNAQLFDFDDLRVDLIQLFDAAPNLRELKVGGWNCDWRVSAMLKKKFRQLKSLALLTQDYGGVGRLGISESALEKIGGGELPKRLEEILLRDTLLEDDELSLEGMEIPKIPSIKRLSLFTSSRMPTSEYAALGLGPSPKTVSHIGKTVTAQLLQAPNLTTIQLLYLDENYPPTYDTPCADNSRYFASPSTWEADGHRGLVLRTYGTATPLIHIRGLSRAMESKKGETYVGGRRAWRHFAKYRQRTVPFQILAEAYGEAGMSMDWTEGGRGIRFGDSEEKASQAWSVLDTWRDGADDMSEVEYETDSDDMEGSSEDDDDDDEDQDMMQEGDVNGFHLDLTSDFEDDDGDEGWETDDDGDPLGGWDF